MVFLKRRQAKEVEEAGKRNPTFCEAKMSRFEMLLFPARTADSEVYLHSEKLKLSSLDVYNCKTQYLFPPAALNLERFAGSAREQNGIEKSFSLSK